MKIFRVQIKTLKPKQTENKQTEKQTETETETTKTCPVLSHPAATARSPAQPVRKPVTTCARVHLDTLIILNRLSVNWLTPANLNPATVLTLFSF